MSGADLVRAIRQRGLDTPVIGFSIGGTKARTAFLDAGADMYLDKPVMLRDIFGTLKRLVHAARSEG
jgi:DNA-binding response OmpR family regulator